MRLKFFAIISTIVIIVSAGFYWYYQESQERIQTLVKNNSKLETAIESNENTINSLRASYEQSREELRRVNEKFAQIRNQNNVLSRKLEEHDLGVLGNAKPRLVERIVNSASSDANRCFELLSGATLTEEEKNADTPKQFNSECPWLFDSNSSR